MLQDEHLAEFQTKHWRTTPCVFRNAINVSAYPMPVRDICALTQNDLVESRMINSDFELLLGPFEHSGDADAELIPPDHLLLVQCLEAHFETAERLTREQFHFIPPWQIDDVMASIGHSGASCGAHFDLYDVFLVQQEGYKRWQLDTGGHTDADLDSNEEIRVLKTFEPTETHELAPGDVLYIPPGVGHFGVCKGAAGRPSVTLSVGIRNPSPAELLADLSEFLIEGLTENIPMNSQLYPADSGLSETIGNDLFQVTRRLFNPATLLRWYGVYATRLREPDLLQPDDDRQYTRGVGLTVTLPTRLTYATIENIFYLFINGEVFALPPEDRPWATRLCSERSIEPAPVVSRIGESCLQSLLLSGALV